MYRQYPFSKQKQQKAKVKETDPTRGFGSSLLHGVQENTLIRLSWI